MAKTKTTEKRVAEEVLQRPETITIAGTEYEVAPPSVATIIMVSEAVAELPHMSLDSDNLVEDMLREARNCRPIGKAVAVMVLGAKRIREDEERRREARTHGWLHKLPLIGRMFRRGRDTGLLGRLSEKILEDAEPKELQQAMAALIMRMQLGDFFGLTTFLNGVNMTKPTREVGRTTASGR